MLSVFKVFKRDKKAKSTLSLKLAEKENLCAGLGMGTARTDLVCNKVKRGGSHSW